ncbi:MAG: hypothetical protein H7235_10155 [Bdellovibrionaceae bacterium]|nr:hypothetical protein [Pseudobdellovibrionaceae bacterium]
MNRYNVLLIFSTLFLIQCVQKNDITKDVSNISNEVPSIGRNIASPPFEFPVCHNKKTNYLEPQLQKLSFEYLKKDENRWTNSIPMACIQFAQKNFRGSFAYCDHENDKPVVGAPKPCLSENYTRLVYNAYHDVTNCFNVDPKSSFLQIMIESGFHINAINKTGFDAGITQFTKNGILRVMDRNIAAKTSQILLESSNPACERISSVFREMQSDGFKIERRCSMIALPHNPYRALVFHYLHTMRDQNDLKRVLVDRPEINAVMTDDVLIQLVYMAYNRGITGTLRLLDGYVESRKKVNVTITAQDLDLWKNLTRARKILKNEPEKRAILKSAKIKKLSFAEYAMIYDQNYLGAMAEASELVKSKLGNQCF